MNIKRHLAIVAVASALALATLSAQGIGSINSLLGRMDAGGGLVVTSVVYTGSNAATGAIGSLPGATDSNNALKVTFSDSTQALGNSTSANLQFGGTTSAFPMLKRSATTLQLRTADDAGYTHFVAGNIYATSAAITNGIGATDGGVVKRTVWTGTLTTANFLCAAVTCDVQIATLPARTIIVGVVADLTVAFACSGTCTTATLSATLGTVAGGAQLLASFDVDAATGQFGDADAEMGTLLTKASTSAGFGGIASWSSTSPVTLRLTSGTGNIGTGAATNLSSGTINFYIMTERMP